MHSRERSAFVLSLCLLALPAWGDPKPSKPMECQDAAEGAPCKTERGSGRCGAHRLKTEYGKTYSFPVCMTEPEYAAYQQELDDENTLRLWTRVGGAGLVGGIAVLLVYGWRRMRKPRTPSVLS